MNMCPSNKRKTAPELCLKGQVFFIFSSHQSLETVKDRISLLGGKVDPFLSRDVTTILVEDNHLVRSQLLTNDLPIKSAYTTNGAVVTSLPYPNNLCNVPSTSSGINFLAANSSNSPYRVICYARQWGIQVLGIDQFLTWIEPQVKTAIHLKKKSENVSNLSGCFIKFESFYKNYRPCYKMFNNDPDRLLPLKNANILVKPETCNVILNKPVGSRQLNFSHMDISSHAIRQGKDVNVSAKVNDKKPQYNNKAKPKEENNYCECCRTHFADLKQHIKSVKHQNFVSDEKNYESVHDVLKMLPTPQEFIDKLQNPSPDSGLMLTNEDTPLSLSVANTPETDYPMPLNLQIKKDNVPEVLMPIDLHVVKDYSLPVTQTLNVKRDEDMPVPLDLHIKRDNEIKIETKDIKQETNLFSDLEHLTSFKKVEPDVIQPKIEVPNDDVAENIEMDEKQHDEMIEDMQCEDINGDPLFDKNNDNATALAQFCLKNLDSYWLENLPCEMDDMVFDDDIFDFDDGKSKLDNEYQEPVDENFPTPDVTQAPDLVADVSTPSLKSQTNANTSFFINSPVDIKDVIKNEPTNLHESFASSCKLEKDLKDSLLPENITPSFNEPLLEDKKQIFSIAAFCSDKIGIETPTYSNAIPNKNTEPLFSSESSDDENGNVLISNALNFITNSDNEMKVDKDSSEENSVDRHCSGIAIPEQKYVTSEINVDDQNYKETTFIDPSIISSQIKIQQEDQKTSFPIPDSPATEIKIDIDYNKKGSAQVNEFVTSKLKISDKNSQENSVPLEQCSFSEMEVGCKTSKKNLAPVENPLSSERSVTKQNRVLSCHTIDELLYSKNKIKPKHYEENLAVKNVCISANNIGIQNYLGVFPAVEELLPNKIKDDSKSFEEHSVIKNTSGNANGKNTGNNFSAMNELLPSEEKIDSKSYVVHSVIKNTCSSDSYVDKQNQLITSADEIYPKNCEVSEVRNNSKKSEECVTVKNVQCNETKILKESYKISYPLSSNERTLDKELKTNTTNVETATSAHVLAVTKNESRAYQGIKTSMPSSEEIVARKSMCSGGTMTIMKSEMKNKSEMKSNKSEMKRKKVKLSRKSNEQNTVAEKNVSSGHGPPLKKICERKSDQEMKINRKISEEIVDTRKLISSKDFPSKTNFSENKSDQKMKTETKTVETSVAVQNISTVQVPVMKKFCESKVDQSKKIDQKSLENIDVTRKDLSFVNNSTMIKLSERKIDQVVTVNKKYSEGSSVLEKDASSAYSPVVKKFCKNISDQEVKIKKTSEVSNNLLVDKTTVCKESNERSDISGKKTSYKEKVKKKHEHFLENQKHRSFSHGKVSEKKVSHKSFPTMHTTYNSQVGQSNRDVVGNIKQISSKEACDSQREMKNSLLVKKHTFSETNVIKHNKKRTYVEVSANPCQYLNTSDKSSVNLCSSNVVPVGSSVNVQTVKIPQKKSSSKLQNLPPLWSVQILPGSGVRLKFTCIRHNEVEAHQSGHRESLMSD